MKFIQSIGVFAVLSASVFAGKCGVQPPAPEYSASPVEPVPTSSALEYTTSSSSSSSSTEAAPTSSAPEYTATSSTTYPASYYTTVENPFSTLPVSSVDGASTASTTYPENYYTSVENPFSTLPMSSVDDASTTSTTYPASYYTTVENPFSTLPMSTVDDASTASTTTPANYYTSVENPFSTYSVSADSSTAEPTETPSYSYQLTLEQLNAAIPDRAGSDSCSSASFPDECATNKQALPAINAALAKYGVTKRSEVVAVISLMAFESSNWLYNTNHWPGRAGQGTRNMQMANFNQEYATTLHPEQAAAVLASSADPTSDDTVNALRALVLNDNDSFGSGFWYLVNHASAYHDTGKIAEDSLDSFKDYVQNGVGASWDDARQTIWETVNSAISA
ncbi:hypothetical protein LPJ57_003655 [Coemansia sp. RSA 486]|nr:hypothetical protein LPJ57_003655 [Coemansia sp. RSA 486]